jgi:hypothetical protein
MARALLTEAVLNSSKLLQILTKSCENFKHHLCIGFYTIPKM